METLLIFTPRSVSDTEIRLAVPRVRSIGALMHLLGVRVSGGSYRIFRRRLREMNVNTDHWNGLKSRNRSYTLSDLLVVGGPHTAGLKRRLIDAGVMVNRCVTCGLSEWMKQSLVLHLDHINGIPSDNRIENLRLLCPNCHSQTATYCRGSQRKRQRTSTQCAMCSLEIPGHRLLCNACLRECRQKHARRVAKNNIGKHLRIAWPTVSVVREMVNTTSFRAAGARLGVSDNAVRKHLRRSSSDCLRGEGLEPPT